LKNLNQLIENKYCHFKEYVIDVNNPHSFLAVFFYMMCDRAVSLLEKYQNFYFLTGTFPWYELDKIKDLNLGFFNNLYAIVNFFLAEKQGYKVSAFKALNFTPISSNKIEDYNIGATLMRCYLLNILIETSFKSIQDGEETEFLKYDSKMMIDVIQALVNENCMNLDIVQNFFISTRFDLYNNFIEINLKDKNLDFNRILNENENENHCNNFYSIINNKLFSFVKLSEIDHAENAYKPFDLVPFSKKFLEFCLSMFEHMNNIVNDYYQKYHDFTQNFPNYSPNLLLSYDKLLEVLSKLQQYIDENFEVKGKQYKLDSTNFFLNDQHNVNEFIKNYISKDEEEKRLVEELNSYGIQEKKFENYCKRCYDDKFKVITLSCNHEICEECIRNYVSQKTFNLVLVKFSNEGVLNCFKCPFEDCSVFLKRNEIFSPFSIYAKSLSNNYFSVLFY
jgi:hypothetical protein